MSEIQNEAVRIDLSGRIDSENAAETEKKIEQVIGGRTDVPIILDAGNLEYISSAGLRVLLRIKKTNPEMKITGVNPEVYEILEMTGFTEILEVEKAYRVVSVEGCEEIGRGANGVIYRFDKDNVVKTYTNPDALAEIQHEREVARLALILGIPTAISYDVVRVGDSYGSVFELLNARSFSKILADEPEKMDWCVKEYVNMLKKIHGTLVPAGKLPDEKETVVGWAEFMQDHLPADIGKKLLSMVRAVPHDDHMIHGDYHTKNLMLQGDEVLLIDMDTLAVGHPVFELASMFNAFIGFSEIDHDQVKKFQGFDLETSKTFWYKALAAYLGTDNEKKMQEVEDKARIVGYTRLVRRSIRRGGLDDPEKKAEIEHWRDELIELVQKYDTLLFERSEIEVPADNEQLSEVLGFIERTLEPYDCAPKAMMQITLAAEEIFANIASYAYGEKKGTAVIHIDVEEDTRTTRITFRDSGMPFDPLQRQDPDVTLPAEEREVGGLGVFLVRKTMDEVSYKYEDGQNVLTIGKKI